MATTTKTTAIPKPAEVKKTTTPVAATKPAASTTSLPKEIFGVKVNTQAIFDSIMSERASVRQGTHKVKTRGEVSGTGKKPFAQKGTGNARSGSLRSPQNVGGGIVWGPTNNRNYTLKVNKKVKKLAYKSAFTLKANDKAVIVHNFKIAGKPNTKSMIKQIADLKLKKDFKKVLIVTDDMVVAKSIDNLQKVTAKSLSTLKIEAIVNSDVLIFSKEAMKKLGGKK